MEQQQQHQQQDQDLNLEEFFPQVRYIQSQQSDKNMNAKISDFSYNQQQQQSSQPLSQISTVQLTSSQASSNDLDQQKQKKKLQLNVKAQSFQQQPLQINLENQNNQSGLPIINEDSLDNIQLAQSLNLSKMNQEKQIQTILQNQGIYKQVSMEDFQDKMIEDYSQRTRQRFYTTILPSMPSINMQMQQQQQQQQPQQQIPVQQLKKAETMQEMNSNITLSNSQQINQKMKEPILEHLDINIFKVNPCTQNTHHNHKNCINFHNMKDRRRAGCNYCSEMCENIEKDGTCIKGDNCNKCHNRVEQLYHPKKYKKRFCSYYPMNISNCDYGQYCSFAHNEDEIQIDLIHNYDFDDDFYMFHFKTVWCPYNLTQHDKSFCVYAHNWQDYRRKPQEYDYEPILCTNWKVNEYVLDYENGCPLQYKCKQSHGWKENEFHPLTYKTRACLGGKNCITGKDCPFYHGTQDKRLISSLVLTGQFKYIPRNRFLTKEKPYEANKKQQQNQKSQQQQSQQSSNVQPITQMLSSQKNLSTNQQQQQQLQQQHYFLQKQQQQQQQQQQQLSSHQNQFNQYGNIKQIQSLPLPQIQNVEDQILFSDFQTQLFQSQNQLGAGLPPPGFQQKKAYQQYLQDEFNQLNLK